MVTNDPGYRSYFHDQHVKNGWRIAKVNGVPCKDVDANFFERFKIPDEFSITFEYVNVFLPQLKICSVYSRMDLYHVNKK